MKKEILLLALLGGCIGCKSAIPLDTKPKDLSGIRALEDRFIAAFKAKDVDAIMMCYIPGQGMVVFDVTPPRQYTGADAYRSDWQEFFAAFPGPADASISDLDIAVGGGDVAYSHSIQHVSMTGKDGKKMEMTVRVTDGYTKVNGVWLISHEHVSVPVDLDTLKADLNSN